MKATIEEGMNITLIIPVDKHDEKISYKVKSVNKALDAVARVLHAGLGGDPGDTLELKFVANTEDPRVKMVCNNIPSTFKMLNKERSKENK